MSGASDAVTPGALLDLTIDQPAVGGRMIARHGGRVILVAGALPGERVRARIDGARRDVPLASVEEVVVAGADRRPAADDATCGGNVFAHIAYPRQLTLKGEIVADAFARIGHVTPPGPLTIAPSPEHGYRLRARLHAAGV
ncbi:MAG TPA: 23S rRNA (uracil(1939)-C(5))-methyltransferase RlmD, partial [Acidobacteria bacterium]|nr:23S rRNA (uracil(1939)-C(5))-methyltransferase RlmD [Acidobacteriota bacterium]